MNRDRSDVFIVVGGMLEKEKVLTWYESLIEAGELDEEKTKDVRR